MLIRKATENDIKDLLDIYEYAKQYMKENNNPNQWNEDYPSLKTIKEDLESSRIYVCVDDDNKILGTFVFYIAEELSYKHIYEGNWLNDEEYAVIHRVATRANKKGVASFCLRWCFNQHNNIRIDTFIDNIPMQNLLAKENFVRCGIIYTDLDGNKMPEHKRIAFHKIK